VSGERLIHLDLGTGAFSRGWFEALLGEAVARAHREDAPLALIWVDLDETAILLDERGAPAVEAALSTLAQAISAAVDGLGPIGRVGDDSLAVVLLGTTLPHAMRIGHAIRRAIAETRVRGLPLGDEPFHVTASVGVAALRPHEPWGNFSDAAEEACVRAKQGGRNRVAPR